MELNPERLQILHLCLFEDVLGIDVGFVNSNLTQLASAYFGILHCSKGTCEKKERVE